MPVIVFDARRSRAVRVGGKRYLLLRSATGAPVKIESSCRHRGGPLDLGDVVCDRDGEPAALLCPWHQRAQTLKTLLRRALPTVIRDGVHGAFILPFDTGDESCN